MSTKRLSYKESQKLMDARKVSKRTVEPWLVRVAESVPAGKVYVFTTTYLTANEVRGIWQGEPSLALRTPPAGLAIYLSTQDSIRTTFYGRRSSVEVRHEQESKQWVLTFSMEGEQGDDVGSVTSVDGEAPPDMLAKSEEITVRSEVQESKSFFSSAAGYVSKGMKSTASSMFGRSKNKVNDKSSIGSAV